MTQFPGLAVFDTLRTTAGTGGHIVTTWYATAAPPAEVLAWYGQHLGTYDRDLPGAWTARRAEGEMRHFHSVTVHAPHESPPGPSPAQPVPAGTATVVRDDTGAVIVAQPRPEPQPRRSWWSRWFG